MDVESPSLPILIYGCGNPGRQDDGLGPALVAELEAWARAEGCRRVLVIGRPGWERVLAPEGYAPLARIIAKEL